jgi:hypothetical protein
MSSGKNSVSKEIKALTSLSLIEFEGLLPDFDKAW